MVPPAAVVATTKNSPPAAVVATTKNGPPAAKSWGAGGDRMPYQRSASESNLLCRNNVLRSKLIFVASMKGRDGGRKTEVEG